MRKNEKVLQHILSGVAPTHNYQYFKEKEKYKTKNTIPCPLATAQRRKIRYKVRGDHTKKKSKVTHVVNLSTKKSYAVHPTVNAKISIFRFSNKSLYP